MTTPRWLTHITLVLGLALSIGCSRDNKKKAPTASASASSQATTPAASARVKDNSPPRLWHPKPPPTEVPIPVGPRFSILAGKGIGPIRFGANAQTIERLMDLPCEVKTAEVCRYFSRAVEFTLKDGVCSAVTIHRQGRPAGKDKSGRARNYGIFNGGLPPDFELMMLQKVIMEHLGEPLKKEPVHDQPDFSTVERHYYNGLVVEYDQLENEKVVLGEIEVIPAGATP
jgi:hypothetical protein